MLKNKEDIINWLNDYCIQNYELIEDKENGYTVNVHGSVLLLDINVRILKVKFNHIKGSFVVQNCQLHSLQNGPESVEGNFNCSHNKLKNLQYCPAQVGGSFICNSNYITNLQGMPESVKNLDCSDNRLSDFKGAPRLVGGNLNASMNKITTLHHCPDIIEGFFAVNYNNIKSLDIKHFPKFVGGGIFISDNPALQELPHVERFQDLRSMLEKKELGILIAPCLGKSVHKI